jgi:signal transduction histidine kinase
MTNTYKAMRASYHIRIVVYALALALMAVALVAGVYATWLRNVWKRETGEFLVENAQMAEEFRARLREVNLHLLSYECSRQETYRRQFTQAATNLSIWLDDSSRSTQVIENREVLHRLNEELGRYLARVNAHLDQRSLAGTNNAGQALLALIEEAMPPLQALRDQLAKNQRAAFDAYIARVLRERDRLWYALYACMALTALCGAVLADVVYRDLIAPLRRTVVRSRALLEQQEKLAALGLLTAGLAHEIRNPLNSIKARLFTQRRILGEHSPGLEDNRFIDEEIDRLEGIVREALQFARPAPPALQRLRLVAVLQPMFEFLEPSLRKSEIQIKTDFQADAEITTDPNQLKQALLNLVNNAAESITRGGAITLRTREATLRSKGRKFPAIALEVADTGKGISPEAQKRLFDPFFTTKENGTGLGLSITARIVHAHGGMIECESAPGHGALLRILLPVVRSHEKDPHPAH